VKEMAVTGGAGRDNCLEAPFFSLDQVSVRQSKSELFTELMGRASSAAVPIWNINEFNAIALADRSKGPIKFLRCALEGATRIVANIHIEVLLFPQVSSALPKNLPDRTEVPDSVGQKAEFTLSQHQWAEMGVFHWLTGSHVETHDQPEFVNPAVPPNGIEEDFVEGDNVFLTCGDTLLNGHLPERIHDCGDFDLFWATGRTRLTRCTEPNRRTLENLFLCIELDMPENLSGPYIHLQGDRAARGAFATLDTTGCVFSTQSKDLISKLVNVLLAI